MALSNAERQKRYRERRKTTPNTTPSAWANQLTATYKRWKQEFERDGQDYSLLHFVGDLVEGEYEARDLLVPILCEMMGLARDPWPGLTANDVVRMTKRRKKRDVQERRINTWSESGELGAYDKLKAAQNKIWLEENPVHPETPQMLPL